MPRQRSLPLLPSLGLTLALALGFAAPAAAAVPGWTPVGPGLGYSGFNHANALVTHPASPRTVWAALTGGGVLRSTDRGATWRNTGAELGEVRGLAADLSAPGALWAATATAIFHTGDGGTHWQPISDASLPAGLDGLDLLDLAAPRQAGAPLYAWTLRRVLESTDGGRGWRLVADLGAGPWIGGVLPAGPGILYLTVARSGGYEMRTTRDGGATWTSLPCPDLEYGIARTALTPAALFLSPNLTTSGLLRSTDGGTVWREVLAGGPFDLLADPQTPGTLWALDLATRLLSLTRDDGESWTALGTVPLDQLDAAGPEPGTLFGEVFDVQSAVVRGTVSGVSGAGGAPAWTPVLPLFDGPERPPTRISFQPGHPSRTAFVLAHILFRSDDGGTTWWWLPAAPAGINDAAIDPADANRLAVAGYSGAATSTDGGRTWTPRSLDSEAHAELMARTSPRTLLVGGCGILRSPDNGRRWVQVLPCHNRQRRGDFQIVQKLAADPAHPDLVFALAFLDRYYYPDHGPLESHMSSTLWRSTDGGRSWQAVALDINAFEYDAESGLLWEVRGTDLLLSRDLGTTWQAMAQLPLRQGPYGLIDWVTDLVAPAGLAGTFYVSTRFDLLRTRDDGRTWETLLPGGDLLLIPAPGAPRTVFGLSHEGLYRLRMPE